MWEIQKIVVELGFSFFHPDDLTILAKNESNTYLSLDAIYLSPEIIQLNLKMNNVTQEVKNQVISRLTEAIHSNHAFF